MNVIAKHTLNSIRKNPLQSFVITFSILLVTACMLFAFNVKGIFYDISALWAESRFYGADMQLEMSAQSDCKELFEALDGMDFVKEYAAYGHIGDSAIKTEDKTLAVECIFAEDKEVLNRLSGSEVLRTVSPIEGELSGAVSHKFVETIGADVGDTVDLAVSGTALDIDATGYVTVRITAVLNSTGFYYTNGTSERIVIDYSDLDAKTPLNIRNYSNFLIYLDDPNGLTADGVTQVEAVKKAAVEATGNKLSVRIADGYAEKAVERSVSGSMQTLGIAVAVVTMLMAVMIYFSYSVVARNRTEELSKFKAAGATPAQSVAIMYAEVAVYVVVGGILGLIVGAGALKLLEGILRLQIAGMTIRVEAWKYVAAFAVAALSAALASAPPAVRIGTKSIAALRSDSVRFTVKAPLWLSLASTSAFIAVFSALFFSEGDALMPVMIVFLTVTLIWAVTTVPHLLTAAGRLCEKLFPRRESDIAAMEMPVNAGVSTVTVMLVLLIAFVWTGFCILDIVRMTAVIADSRITSDFLVPGYAVGEEQENEKLATYLSVDGITDGSFAEKIALYDIYREDGSTYMFDSGIQLYMVSSSEAFPYICPEVDPEAAERFDSATRPIILHYSAIAEGGFETGDKIRLQVWSNTGSCFLEGEFEVVGADYTFTCYDNVAFIRIADCVKESGERIYGNLCYYLNGDREAFPEIREQIDSGNNLLFDSDYYFTGNTFNEVLMELLDVFVGVIFAVAALGIIDLVAVTAAERKREYAVYRLSGMTAGGALRLAVTEAAVISLIGFIAGFLFCLGINQSVPALGLIVSKYIPRTLFAVEIVYIALAGAGTVFFSWLLFTFFTAIIARRSKRFRLGTGFMNE